MKSAVSLAVAAAVALAGSAALAREQGAGGAPTGPQGDYPVIIGGPYVIDGTTFTPADTLNYDAVGYAVAAGPNSSGSWGISAAHRTLPVPCYVEVTSLVSGRTALVRVDRRGPMAGGANRLIELSPSAWAQLGLPLAGAAPVRVRRVNPPEPERAQLRAGQQAPLRMDTPPGLLTALKRKLGLPPAPDGDLPHEAAPAPGKTAATVPRPVRKPAPAARAETLAPVPPPAAVPQRTPTPAPRSSAGSAEPGLFVQVGAYSSRARADQVAARVGGAVTSAGPVFRVRIGAASRAEAEAALAKARRAGYADARIQHGG